MVAHSGPLMQSNMMLLAAWARIWPILRPTLGWCCIIIGVLGVLLPVIPGMPLLFPGIALVGRRTRVIRWWAVLIKRQLRRWAALRLPLIGQAGRWALLAQHQVSRQRRRLAWWYMDRRTRRP